MSLKSQKRLAASLLGGGLNRVWIDPEENDRVQSAITREEIKSLIREGRISLLPKTGISRGRHRAKSGRRKKAGSRKGGQKPGKEAGFSRSERSGDTYDGSEIRDSCPPETTLLCWVWRRVERSVAG